MIDQEKTYRPDWWNYSFCIEVDFDPKKTSMRRGGYYYEKAFTPESFRNAMLAFSYDYMLGVEVENVSTLIKLNGNMRLRPGPLWANSHYKGDVYDYPVIWDPFTRFPFGPLEQRI